MPKKKKTKKITTTTPSLPEWFQRCQNKHEIIEYDTNRYPFRELISKWFQIKDDGDDNPNRSSSLDHLHTLPEVYNSKVPIHPRIVNAWKKSNKEKLPYPLSKEAQCPFNSTIQNHFFHENEHYHNFLMTYRRFIQEVILPHCCPCGSTKSSNSDDGVKTDTGRVDNPPPLSLSDGKSTISILPNVKTPCSCNVIYQCPPTLRVVLPNGKPTISVHKDKDYSGHYPGEINFWLPVTSSTYGSNTLWLDERTTPSKHVVEPTTTNKEDYYQPIQLTYGQLYKFNGYHCNHYTKHNTTSICRVSFDFRVIPSLLFPIEVPKTHIGEFCIEETTTILPPSNNNNNNTTTTTNPSTTKEEEEEKEEKRGYIVYPHPFLLSRNNASDKQKIGSSP